MAQNDEHLLENMNQIVKSCNARGEKLHIVADRLQNIRDTLVFSDQSWSNELTQHIVTLDSAASFVPSTDEEAKTLEKAIETALMNLSRLIEQKLSDI